MKAQTILTTVILAAALGAQARAKNFEDFKIDWSERSLDQTGVLMCDDSFFDGARLVVDGARDSFKYSFDGKTDAKVTVKEQKSGGKTQTVLTILSSDGFTMELKQLSTGKKAMVEEGDAC